MRYITASLGFIICVASLPAFADDTYQRNTGVSIGFGSTALSIRKSVSESTLVFAGINSSYFHNNSTLSGGNNISGGDSKSIANSNSLGLGVRHFLSLDKFSKFAEGALSIDYTEGRNSFGSNNYVAQVSLSAVYGIEYFLASNLSIEGKAGIGISYSKSTSAPFKYISKQISLPLASTAITYYW
ncbi:MAG: hypothetical protein HOO95_08145 [Gallionella sp.]|nr:hypothetical protein [Gallionella sp.]